jgi:hypothetical protein
MPQARKSARSSSRRSTTFKEPAALKRLNSSLDAAQKALTELRGQAGRAAGQNTRSLHKGLSKFLSDARRDTGKFTSALKRDFESAQKAVTSTSAQRTRTSGTSTRRSTRRTTSRSTRKSS